MIVQLCLPTIQTPISGEIGSLACQTTGYNAQPIYILITFRVCHYRSLRLIDQNLDLWSWKFTVARIYSQLV